ncbi:MAG TPA: tetratricopeptide repeat protein [bacterium]|nr:tetratricopeptide repeat protein [bacterium]
MTTLLVRVAFVLAYLSFAVSLYAQGSYDLGNRLFAEGRTAEAAETYEKSLHEGKSEVAAHCRFMLASCFEQMSDFEKAEKNYRLVWQLFPRSPWADDALLRVAAHLSKSRDINDVKAAKSYLVKIQGLYPQSSLLADSLCLLGEDNILLHEFDEAQRNLTEVLDKYSDSGLATRAHFALGRLYSDDENELRDLDRALDEFRLVVEESPDSPCAPWAYFSIGNVLRSQKKWEHARPYFQAVIEQYDRTLCAAAARPMLVLSQVERDQFLRGRDSFEQLLAIVNQDQRPVMLKKVVVLPQPRQVTKLEIVSDEAYSDEARAIYKGDVKVSAGRMRIFADYVVCELRSQVVRASGKSTRLQFGKEFVLDCKQLTFDVKKQRGVASGDVRFVEGGSGVLALGSGSGPKVKVVKSLVFLIKDGQALSLSEKE